MLTDKGEKQNLINKPFCKIVYSIILDNFSLNMIYQLKKFVCLHIIKKPLVRGPLPGIASKASR